MATQFSPPVLVEFSFIEKMAFERLFTRFGKDWKRIASYFVSKSPMDIKRYWVQKTRRENILREQIASMEMQAFAQGTKICIKNSPFTWKLIPVEKSTPLSDLDILANAAATL